MEDSVEELVEHVSGPSPDKRDLIRYNVEYLNTIDDRFSDRAARLFINPGTESYAQALTLMRHWIARFREVPQAKREALNMNPLAGKDYNEAGIALYDSTLAFSVNGMDYPSRYSPMKWFRFGKEADFYLSKSGTIHRPDIFTASTDELNRYFRSAAVAASMLDVRKDEEKLISRVSNFITWASTQEDTDAVLAAALRMGNLDSAALSAVVTMQKSTPPVLHDGVL